MKVQVRPLLMHQALPHLQRRLPKLADLSSVRISSSFHTFGHQLSLISQMCPVILAL